MLRTLVAAPAAMIRPETSGLIGQARAIPETSTFTTAPVTFTTHFLGRAGHRVTVTWEEGARCSRIYAQIKATIGFIFSIPQM